MGTASATTHNAKGRTQQAAASVQDSVGQAADTMRQTAGQLGEAVSGAPEQAVRQTQGNPLAAGLIAFGAGLPAASLLPTSQAEEQAASQLSEKAGEAMEPVKQAAMESAQHVKEDATERAGQAAQEVKDTAAEAARTTKEEASGQAGQSGRQVTDEARQQPPGSA
ncbi:MAG TPA: hypothetical protein VK545_21635 [Streptomyces sp.]|nr:hypothetical protein [Streptomyces sp.]